MTTYYLGGGDPAMTMMILRRMSSALPNDANEAAEAAGTIPFHLADIGEGIAEVELLQWFVSPGDKISQFDRVCEVQSDKASVEITSRFDGIVSILCGNVGDVMCVGQPLLYMQTSVASYGAVAMDDSLGLLSSSLNNVDDVRDRLSIPMVGAKYSTSHGGDYATATITNTVCNTKVLTSPAVRKLGKENDIDLSTVIGTGPGGRILKADMQRIIDPASSYTSYPTSAPSFISTPMIDVTNTANATITMPKVGGEGRGTTVVPIRGYHRLMVKTMTSSLQVPHMVYADEINVSNLTEVRNSLRPMAAATAGVKLTYMPFFVKAASLALSKYPALNSTIDTENMTLTYHAEHRIGIAVDTSKGLAVPVISVCQDKSVLDIAMELNRLLMLATEGSLSEVDIANPTFTLSNIGAIGGTYMSPVVLPPQVAIGAMGKIQRLPRFVDDESNVVESVRIMPISWGGDHRAVDGATMARFSNLWKSYCENPSSMMFIMR